MNAAHFSPPNIVLFLVDDMGWQDTAEPFWKERTPFNDRYRTPNMERLARSGVKFSQAYACAVCSPTRVSLLTGLNAARHRVTTWTMNRDEPRDAPSDELDFPAWNMNGICPDGSVPNTVQARCLPSYLAAAGYRTVHVGKAHFGAGGTPGADPLNLGFGVNIAGHAAGGPGSYLIIEDFFVTILEMAGVASDAATDGVSFVPLLRGERGCSAGRSLFWHYPNCWGPTGPGIGSYSSIRRDDWKLIYYHEPSRAERYELFNITDDIGETQNLAAAEPERRQALSVELRNFLISVDAQMPIDKKTGELVPLPGE